MKCNECGQEIVDNKEYCPNCGKKIRENNLGVNKKTIIIITTMFILFAVGICLSIMFLGIDKELEPYLKDTNNNNSEQIDEPIETDNNIKEYFGKYVIHDIKTTSKTPKDLIEKKDEILGWVVYFSNNKVKLGLYKIDWIIIENPSMVIDNNTDMSYLFDDDTIINIAASGENSMLQDNKKINFIISNNKLYVYYYNTLFELVESNYNFKRNNNFYKINLIEQNYTKEINEKLENINNEIKKDVESLEGYVINVDYRIIEDDNIKHILIDKKIGPPYSGAYVSTYGITYNKNTLKMYNLEEYLSYRNRNYENIKNIYNTKVSQFSENPEDNLSDIIPITPNSLYYVINNVIYIQYANSIHGPLFINIDL